MKAELTLDALRTALNERRPEPGWMHHSDRGVQYACGEYVQLVEGAGGQVSMSRPGNPYDNAYCESFIGKLKQEQWDGRGYADIAAVRKDLQRMLEQVYNKERIHSALGYLTPAEFEEQHTASPAPSAPRSPSLVSLSR